MQLWMPRPGSGPVPAPHGENIVRASSTTEKIDMLIRDFFSDATKFLSGPERQREKKQVVKRLANRLQVNIARTDVDSADLDYIFRNLSQSMISTAEEFAETDSKAFGEACYYFQTTRIVTVFDAERDNLLRLCEDAPRKPAGPAGAGPPPATAPPAAPAPRHGAGNPPRDDVDAGRGPGAAAPRRQQRADNRHGSGAGNPPRILDANRSDPDWFELPQAGRGHSWQEWSTEDTSNHDSRRDEGSDRWRRGWDNSSWRP